MFYERQWRTVKYYLAHVLQLLPHRKQTGNGTTLLRPASLILICLLNDSVFPIECVVLRPFFHGMEYKAK